MNEDENIATYFLRVDEVVKSIRGLGEKLEDSIIVKKVLISLLNRYDPKVSALEESRELKTLKMDELYGIFNGFIKSYDGLYNHIYANKLCCNILILFHF